MTVFVLIVALFIGWHGIQQDDYVVDKQGKIRFLTLDRPKYPLWLAVMHTLVRPFATFLPKLETEALIRDAKARSGFGDFGNNSALVREGLDTLLHSVNTEASLSPLGSFFVREFFIERLLAQLHLVELIKRHPQILEEPIDSPLIITGLPRTGTTHLHATLSASGDFRFLAFYEGADPFSAVLHSNKTLKKEEDRERKETGKPTTGSSHPPETGRRMACDATPAACTSSSPRNDDLISEANQKLWFLRAANPLLPLMVNVSAETQVEEVYLESTIFTSMIFETMLYLPSYAAWYDRLDHDIVLQHVKIYLQALQYLDRVSSPCSTDFSPRRWVLKSPAHASRLINIFRVFPDAKIVINHRDPLPVVKSVCTMTGYLMRLYTDKIVPTNISRLWIHRVMLLLKDLLAQQSHLQPYADSILHVQAEEYWNDNMGTVRSIYELLQQPLTPASAELMQSYIDAHSRTGSNSIHYSLDILGISKTEIMEKYSDVLLAYSKIYLKKE